MGRYSGLACRGSRVNDQTATIAAQHSGVADWEITLPEPAREAWAADAAGNAESWRQVLPGSQPRGGGN